MKSSKDFHFTDRFGEWKSKIAKEKGISEEHVEEIIDSNFKFIVEAMENPTMPSINVGKWGSFGPSLTRIRVSIMSTFRWNKKYDRDRKLAIPIIEKLWPIRERILKEKAGAWTAKIWHKYFKASAGKDHIVYDGGKKDKSVPDNYYNYSGNGQNVKKD